MSPADSSAGSTFKEWKKSDISTFSSRTSCGSGSMWPRKAPGGIGGTVGDLSQRRPWLLPPLVLQTLQQCVRCPVAMNKQLGVPQDLG